MSDQDLIQALQKKGLLPAASAAKLVKEAAMRERSAEDVLYEERLAPEAEVAQVKSELLNIPYKKIDPNAIGADLLSVIPKDTSRAYEVIPLEKRRDLLVVGMLHPDNLQAQEALRFIAKQNRVSLGVYIVTPSDITAVWRKYAPYRTEIEAAVEEIGPSRQADELYVALEEGARTAEDAPTIKIIAATLREAVEAQASDVHIEPEKERVRIRFRLDGKLEETASVPAALSQPLVSRVKVLAKLRLDENRMPQDGRFRTTIGGRDIDYRVATFPTPSGEKVAIRVLDPSTGLKGLKELGFNDYNLGLIEQAAEAPYGMILITGPTGSGKTTTLYAIMQKLNRDDVNIVTLEDPVEYFMDGINQSQVKPEIGYDFASGLRQILRQDPDIIMVGEIRDEETAGLAVNAALTGHLMLSTLHTNNAIGAVPRLVDLKVPGFLLSASLNLILAQRLVSRLCPDCRKAYPVPDAAMKIVDDALRDLPPALRAKADFKKPYQVFRSEPKPDCKICKGKGVAGRVALAEIFRMTRELGTLLNRDWNEGDLEDEAKRQGMLPMRTDGVLKALQGEVLLEEVLRETE